LGLGGAVGGFLGRLCCPQPSPPAPPLPLPPPGKEQHSSSTTVTSYDPNDKLGPAGFGDANYITTGKSLFYQVLFQNESDVTAPAQHIVVTDALDPNLDLDTLQLTEIDFANQTIAIPSGLDHYETTVSMSANGTPILVDVQAELDRATRQLTLTLDAVDPATGSYPEDPLIGLLYPEDGTGRGIGSISYIVSPITGLPSGTVIDNRGQIIFDYNDPIETPEVHNTLDAAAPTSSVMALPTTTTDRVLNLNWSGVDETGGSGIASYTIYVSVDGGAAMPLFTDTTDTSGTVTVEAGHTYAFYSIATDNVGHVEQPPSIPDTTIQVVGAATTTTLQASEENPKYGDPLTFTATVSAAPALGTPTGTVQFLIDGADYGSPVALVAGVGISGPVKTLAAGQHTISAVYSGDGGFVSSASADLAQTIGKAPLTITADAKSKLYGAADPTLTYTLTGLLNGDSKSVVSEVTLSTATGAAATAGTHAITATGGTAANYTITGVNGTLTVSRAPLIVMAANQSKVYGAADPTLTYIVTGTLYYGDGSSVVSGVTLSIATGVAATVGTHVIAAIGGTAVNYTITDVNGTLTVTPLTTPLRTLVSMVNVKPVSNKKHLVTQILVSLSGAVNATEAQTVGTYRLATPGKKGSFDAKNAGVIKLKSAVYNAATNTVTLTPKKAFALTKPVQLRVNGQSPSGLEDSVGRLIDGDRNGQPGGNAVALLRRGGVTISALTLRTAETTRANTSSAVDLLLLRGDIIDLIRTVDAWRSKHNLARRTEETGLPPVIHGPQFRGLKHTQVVLALRQVKVATEN
jgi:hypothetical protein